MKQIIETGRTIEEALEKALKELQLDKNQVEIEVIQEPSKGFLGLLGSKDATIRVRELDIPHDEVIVENKISTEPVEEKIQNEDIKVSDSEIEKQIREFLGKVLEAMSVEYKISIEKREDAVVVNITSDAPDQLGVVIGKRGVTLDSLQYLLSLVVNKGREDYVRIVLDSENYRLKREETLEKFAKKMADRAIKSRRPVKLESMNPYERRIVHSALSDYKGVKTHSEGKEPYRRVVISVEKYNSKF